MSRGAVARNSILAARGAVAGALLAIGGSTLLATVGDEAAVWITSPVRFARAWSVGVAFVCAALAVTVLVPSAGRVRVALAALAVLPFEASVRDATVYYALVRSGAIHTARALPASLFVTAVLVLGTVFAWRPMRGCWTLARLAAAGAGAGPGGLGSLVVLLLAFGNTDYRRPADCIVVLGARVYDDGTPSLALSDRVAQGVELWREGLAPALVMSGGVDAANGRSEPRTMARLAEDAGVPASAIVLDELGITTRASSESCAALARERGWSRALLVSHDYHLLRAKTSFARAGLEAYTVPAAETRPLARRHVFLLRECVAWLWYARPGSQGG